MQNATQIYTSAAPAPESCDGWQLVEELDYDSDRFRYSWLEAVHNDGRRVIIDLSRFNPLTYDGWFADYIAAGLPNRKTIGSKGPLNCEQFRQLADKSRAPLAREAA